MTELAYAASINSLGLAMDRAYPNALSASGARLHLFLSANQQAASHASQTRTNNEMSGYDLCQRTAVGADSVPYGFQSLRLYGYQ